MDKHGQIERNIIDVVSRFESQAMAFRPESVSASLADPNLIVTLRGAIPAAERNYAQERPPRELLERLYREVFDAAKAELEAAIADILGRVVRGSRIAIDPELGDAILVFVLGQARLTITTQPPGEPESPAR